MARKKYDLEKIVDTRAELMGNGGKVKRTAKAQSLARQTVARWRDGDIPKHIDPKELEQKVAETVQELALGLETSLRLAIPRLQELIPGVTSAKELAVVIGIATEKMQLLRGKPTERIESVDLATFLRQQAPGAGQDRPIRGTNPSAPAAGVAQEATRPN